MKIYINKQFKIKTNKCFLHYCGIGLKHKTHFKEYRAVYFAR
jgi:hypothetical protein